MTHSGQRDAGGFEREWRRRFERFAASATAEHEISGWSEAGLRRRVRAFRDLLGGQGLPAGSRILDLGTGAGTYVRLLAGMGHRVTGADYSVPSLRLARSSDPREGAPYVGADAYRLPFRDATFDLVTMVGIFQVLSEPAGALGEVRRVLRPGGLLLLEILNAGEVFSWAPAIRDRLRRAPPGVRRYRRCAVERELRSAGFRTVAAAPVYLPPRKLPRMEPFLEHPAARWLLGTLPLLPDLLAAAFLVVARDGRSPAGGAPGSPGAGRS